MQDEGLEVDAYGSLVEPRMLFDFADCVACLWVGIQAFSNKVHGTVWRQEPERFRQENPALYGIAYSGKRRNTGEEVGEENPQRPYFRRGRMVLLFEENFGGSVGSCPVELVVHRTRLGGVYNSCTPKVNQFNLSVNVSKWSHLKIDCGSGIPSSFDLWRRSRPWCHGEQCPGYRDNRRHRRAA